MVIKGRDAQRLRVTASYLEEPTESHVTEQIYGNSEETDAPGPWTVYRHDDPTITAMLNLFHKLGFIWLQAP